MKQVFTSQNGVIIANTPEPKVSSGLIKIQVAFSCISVGTEIMSVNGAQKSMLRRAIENPTQVKQVISIVKEQGIKRAISKVGSSMEKLGTNGYSVSGVVVEIGDGVTGFNVGDFVSAGGAGYALHAEYVTVPKNLVVKIPEGLELAIASMGTVGSIAMHGVRRAGLTIGEYGVVYGVGLMGLLALQMMKLSGVKVACIDINLDRLKLAKELGADKIIDSSSEDAVLAIQNWTSGYGADSVLFTASTHLNEPLSQSFNMCRKKGKVVLLGVSGMNIKRSDMYKNEIDFIISSSYGPGRYDVNYENKGLDYPYAYVRWTENRNIYSFLELIRDGKINVEKIKPCIYSVDKAADAYEGIKNDPSHHIITVLDYNFDIKNREGKDSVIRLLEHKSVNKQIMTIGLIGAGGFATSTLLPIITDNKDKFYLKTIVNRSGDNALNAGRHFKAEIISSDENVVFNDPEIDLVVICTRHNSHSELVLRGLSSNKNVYVEKPLATNMQQLNSIISFFNVKDRKVLPHLIVGYNRRFSLYAREIKKHLDDRNSPAFIRYRMNAGFVPIDGWVHADGGRIVGEACHLIDLMQYLIGSEVLTCSVSHFNPISGEFLSEDNRSISLEFNDGSIAVIDYFSCCSHLLPKEYLEVHFENKTIIMDDYKYLTGYGIKVKNYKSNIAEKGHKEEWLALYDALRKGQNPIDLNCLFKTSELSILASKEC